MSPDPIEQQPSLDLPAVQEQPRQSEAEVPKEQASQDVLPSEVERSPEIKQDPTTRPVLAQPQATSNSVINAQHTQQTNDAAAPAQSSDDTSSMIADDVDLIEKEWVAKAKSIVNKTKDDPRKQNVELNKVKAEYMKKRYNHNLRLSNE